MIKTVLHYLAPYSWMKLFHFCLTLFLYHLALDFFLLASYETTFKLPWARLMIPIFHLLLYSIHKLPFDDQFKINKTWSSSGTIASFKAQVFNPSIKSNGNINLSLSKTVSRSSNLFSAVFMIIVILPLDSAGPFGYWLR